jgi:hypothetical protein
VSTSHFHILTFRWTATAAMSAIGLTNITSYAS